MEVFRSWDLDGNGTISMFELQNALATLNVPVADKRSLAQIIQIMDADGSGEVDFGELRRALVIEAPKRKAPKISLDQTSVAKRRGDGRAAA
eukprot:6569925-Prymnesium_polylepis.1